METRSDLLHVAFGTPARSLTLRGPDGPVLASLHGIFAGGASSSVEPLSTAEELQLLVESVLDTGTSPGGTFERFADAPEAAHALAELLP